MKRCHIKRKNTEILNNIEQRIHNPRCIVWRHGSNLALVKHLFKYTHPIPDTSQMGQYVIFFIKYMESHLCLETLSVQLSIYILHDYRIY